MVIVVMENVVMGEEREEDKQKSYLKKMYAGFIFFFYSDVLKTFNVTLRLSFKRHIATLSKAIVKKYNKHDFPALLHQPQRGFGGSQHRSPPYGLCAKQKLYMSFSEHSKLVPGNAQNISALLLFNFQPQRTWAFSSRLRREQESKA